MIIALMDYCVNNDCVHPGFVIIDSPLLSFKEKKELADHEIIDENIQAAFYDSLSKVTGMQIIILENKEPTEFARKRANVIEFTGHLLEGRAGLL